jgi:diaminopimelate decarboxylase
MLAADFEPADAVRNAWETVKRAAAGANAGELLENITLLLEPGRSIIADAGILLTSVRNIKSRPVSSGQRTPENGQPSEVEFPTFRSPLSVDNWLLTDAGFNLLLSMVTYNWYYHLISAERAGEAHNSPYKVAGPLCDGGDVYFDIEGRGRLPEHRFLPENIQLGEVLALLNCGAYTFAQALQYNGRLLPAIVLIDPNGEPLLIRMRDTLRDLTHNDL